MEKSTQVSLEVSVQWEGAHAAHTDRHFIERVNLWRDFFPGDLAASFNGSQVGEAVQARFAAGELVSAYSPSNVRHVKASRFRRRLRDGTELLPCAGRYYPRGLLEGIDGIFPQDRRPFRYLGRNDDTMFVDLDHPLSDVPLGVEVKLANISGSREERGGRCNDIVGDSVENGPGLQDGLPALETDFYSDEPFARGDTADDALFYTSLGLV